MGWFGVICARLQFGVGSTTRMPNAQYLDLLAADAVVEKIMDPSKMQALHARGTCIGHGDADARLGAQK